jgi:hypothetical protein
MAPFSFQNVRKTAEMVEYKSRKWAEMRSEEV